MAITKEEARPGTQVLIRARVDRSTSEGEHGARSVICWVANPLTQRRGDREVSVVCDPDDVTAEANYGVGYIGDDDDRDEVEDPAAVHPALAILTRLLDRFPDPGASAEAPVFAYDDETGNLVIGQGTEASIVELDESESELVARLASGEYPAPA